MVNRVAPWEKLVNGGAPFNMSTELASGVAPLANFLELQLHPPIAPFTNTSQALHCNNKYVKVTKIQENFKNHIVVICLKILA